MERIAPETPGDLSHGKTCSCNIQSGGEVSNRA